jgi:beta-carotene 3-hydroxylase
MGFLIIITTFFCMEAVAWLTHKYVMHGLLWKLHEDHHVKNPESHIERNDSFFLIFALPSVFLFGYWHFMDEVMALYIACGIALYGLAYFLVHDVFIHQRIKIFRRTDNRYLRAIRKAHKVHHKHLGRFIKIACISILLLTFFLSCFL